MIGNITVVRGDTLSLKVRIIRRNSGEDYVMGENDRLYLDIRKTALDDIPEISAVCTAEDCDDEGRALISFGSEDTERLGAGDHYFDVRLETAEGRIVTVIPMSRLRVLRSITDIPAGIPEGHGE